MANEQNLLTPEQRNLTSEEASRMGKLGAEASIKAKKRKKALKELTQIMMDCKPTDSLVNEIKQVFPDLDVEDITNRALMIRKQMDKAVMDGDSKAFEILRDTAGEKPSDKLEMTGRDGEPLNMKYELAPATKEAIEEQKKEREVLDE